MIRIGVTGPIGCGKSTLARWLAEAGAVAIDADEIARAVVERGQPAFEAIVAAFGDGVVRADGELDRAALAAIVFRDPAELQRLEQIVHPAVRPRIVAAVAAAEAAGAPAVVVEAIKLVEAGYAASCDEIWLVRCDPATQLARLRRRRLDEADVQARINSQADMAERLDAAATRTFDTSGPVAETRRVVLAAYAAALGRSRG